LGVLWEAGFQGGIGFIGEWLDLAFFEWSIFVSEFRSGNSFHDAKLIVSITGLQILLPAWFTAWYFALCRHGTREHKITVT
jgi:hypothetical protein